MVGWIELSGRMEEAFVKKSSSLNDKQASATILKIYNNNKIVLVYVQRRIPVLKYYSELVSIKTPVYHDMT
ncbi:hypothetical protein M8J77_017703 [Diaphorina citri]|nr:hypothetical protein M8J77_017703 [Diaphorina citri]